MDILTNPPFGARVEKSLKITEADRYTDELKIAYYKERYGDDYLKALEQVNSNVDKSVLSLYESGKMSTLTEVLFIERCINLLKPGGRLGIVLPEGVLNNPNLQTVRELFERMAKIILITSIPQDVFMASGATVKPSLMFFKKFTIAEATTYKRIRRVVIGRLEQKYADIIKEQNDILEGELTDRTQKREARLKLKQICAKIEEESKSLIRERFDYTIPIAQVEKAGITTTGAECENELTDLRKEYSEYRVENKLWECLKDNYQYKIEGGELFRKCNDKEWKELC